MSTRSKRLPATTALFITWRRPDGGEGRTDTPLRQVLWDVACTAVGVVAEVGYLATSSPTAVIGTHGLRSRVYCVGMDHVDTRTDTGGAELSAKGE